MTETPLDDGAKLPIRMLHDRLLVKLDVEAGDRRSTGGILIPATAAMGKRLAWARVEAVGAHVRSVQVGDRVLFDPDERAEVEVRGEAFILLRERRPRGRLRAHRRGPDRPVPVSGSAKF